MNPVELFAKYYDLESDSYQILYTHSRSVADKALAIAQVHPEMNLDLTFIEEAAMLHDIGIFLCRAPGIGCQGEYEYICHGYLGADLLRQEGFDKHALVCERHTGAGIKLSEIEERGLPLPHRDMLPVSLEEQLICLADKFYSKTRLTEEKTIDQIKKSLAKYGEDTVLRFEQLCKLFLE